MTPAERMLNLSSLPSGATPAAHFLSITQTGGGTGDVYVYGTLDVELLMCEYDVELEPEISVELEGEFEVTLEDPEFDVEVCV